MDTARTSSSPTEPLLSVSFPDTRKSRLPLRFGRPDPPAPPLPLPSHRRPSLPRTVQRAPLGIGGGGTARGAAGVGHPSSTWRSRGVVISPGAGRREGVGAAGRRTAVGGPARGHPSPGNPRRCPHRQVGGLGASRPRPRCRPGNGSAHRRAPRAPGPI